MALYIFSDVHLGSGPESKEIEKKKKIKELCELVKNDGDRLVILGDLFDFWFEYKHTMPKHQFAVLNMLYNLTSNGIKVDYVSGNHDFWMHDFFETEMNLPIHQDFFDLEYNGLKLHLIHGDGLSPSDKGYHFLKRIFRNRLNIWLYRNLLPPDFAHWLASKFSGTSREYTARRDHHFKQDYENYAEQKINNGYDFVAIGHLHLPVYKNFENGVYINTGDFINHFSYAKIDGKNIELKNI
ncbi:MAG: UDP-2,3-diacylglucosamine diphosphatase [Calditrichaeota bacterium]|nr:MAG: UDP-2,3-diacylglucosamine diphosphatase [Calditrichota bacterium]